MPAGGFLRNREIRRTERSRSRDKGSRYGASVHLVLRTGPVINLLANVVHTYSAFVKRETIYLDPYREE